MNEREYLQALTRGIQEAQAAGIKDFREFAKILLKQKLICSIAGPNTQAACHTLALALCNDVVRFSADRRSPTEVTVDEQCVPTADGDEGGRQVVPSHG